MILKGNEKAIENYVSFLKEKKVINSWGATVENIFDLKEGPELESFQVTTQNVDQFNWSPNVEMYI